LIQENLIKLEDTHMLSTRKEHFLIIFINIYS